MLSCFVNNNIPQKSSTIPASTHSSCAHQDRNNVMIIMIIVIMAPFLLLWSYVDFIIMKNGTFRPISAMYIYWQGKNMRKLYSYLPCKHIIILYVLKPLHNLPLLLFVNEIFRAH